MLHGDAERVLETADPALGDVNRPAAGRSMNPSEVEQPRGHGGTESPGQMVTLFAPVNAVPDRRAAGRKRVDVHAERAKLPDAVAG